MSLSIDIKKHFPSFDLEVAFSAEDEVFGLLGASGCGKSLTMRCVAGIETPDEGRIVVNDLVFFDSAAKINLKPQKRKTALLFQNYMLFPNLTVADNVGAGIPKTTAAEERKSIIAEELRRFDVEAFAQRYPAQLSGGQQQRVALARMLAAKPGILMLDEPFSALDAHLKGVLEQNLSSLFDNFQGTILYVSHDIDEAVRFCDKIAVMERGSVTEVDRSRSLIDHPKSVAGLKLSGVKNVTEIKRLSPTTVACNHWGINLTIPSGVPEDAKAVGIRAYNVRRANQPGLNVFRMRVDQVSDSRFDRLCLLSFIDRDPGAEALVAAADQEMRFLHQRIQWRINMLYDQENRPSVGDEILIAFDPENLYLVNH